MKMYLQKISATLAVCLIFANCAFATPIDDMVSPISNPVNFEDARINTEIRPIYMYHELANGFVTGGGDVRVYALQARFAVTEDTAIIATKDGYIDFNPDAGLNDDSGFANIGLGVKHAVYRNSENDQMASVGLRYEAPLGNRDVVQGNGDGSINPFITMACAKGGINKMIGTGFRLPIDGADSSFYDLDLHIDKQFGNFYPSLEVNLVHVLDAGNRLGIADEGADLLNFGSTGSDGKTLVTGALGARYKISDDLNTGVAYQIPLTNGRGSEIFDWRVTADLIYSFDL
jgi:hypothetical protein